MRRNSLLYQGIFVSLQGEGPKAGTPSVFLRLAGCNLGCVYCDSRKAWDEAYENQWRESSVATVAERLLEVKGRASNLVITGGEPLLQQREVENLIRLVQRKFLTIEVETNGTILPGAIARVPNVFFNVSPKLSNSGVERERRINERVLRFFAGHERAYFKFVVSNRAEAEEARDLVRELGIDPRRVYLMPLASNRTQLERVAPVVARLAGRLGFAYSDRLQLRVNLP